MDCYKCMYQWEGKTTCSKYPHEKPIAIMSERADCPNFRELRVVYKGGSWYAVPSGVNGTVTLIGTETRERINVSTKVFLSDAVDLDLRG